MLINQTRPAALEIRLEILAALKGNGASGPRKSRRLSIRTLMDHIQTVETMKRADARSKAD